MVVDVEVVVGVAPVVLVEVVVGVRLVDVEVDVGMVEDEVEVVVAHGVWQRSPQKPGGQMQIVPPQPGTQMPPFVHGFGQHGMPQTPSTQASEQQSAATLHIAPAGWQGPVQTPPMQRPLQQSASTVQAPPRRTQKAWQKGEPSGFVPVWTVPGGQAQVFGCPAQSPQFHTPCSWTQKAPLPLPSVVGVPSHAIGQPSPTS